MDIYQHLLYLNISISVKIVYEIVLMHFMSK